jgi:methylmalonyl-CoA epimerase
MKLIGIDHVSIAVEALAPVLDLLALFGLALESEEVLPEQSITSYMVNAGNTHLELLESTSEDSLLAQFLTTRGPGLHHVCLEVDDLDEAMATLKAKGMRLVESEPRVDLVGRRVFLHPRSGFGTLIGIMQRHPAETRA